MATCERFRISHSHYLGGPPAWTPEDRAKVEAYDAWKASGESGHGLCPQCGTHADWWDPDHGGDRFAFVTDTYRCSGCELKEIEQEALPRAGAKGVKVYLKVNTEGDDDDG